MTDQTAAWIDGDPLMEAIAADVWEQCEHHDSGLIIDDPRNIAAVAAAAVARAHAAAVPAPAADRAALREAIRRAVCEAEGFAWDSDMLEPDEYGDHADAVLSRLPAPADRAAVLREAADAIDAETRQAKADEVLEPDKYRPCRDASAQLRRMADETQQPEACGPAPDQCDAEAGEPCANHEREQAHAEGEHAFCGPECEGIPA